MFQVEIVVADFNYAFNLNNHLKFCLISIH